MCSDDDSAAVEEATKKGAAKEVLRLAKRAAKQGDMVARAEVLRLEKATAKADAKRAKDRAKEVLRLEKLEAKEAKERERIRKAIQKDWDAEEAYEARMDASSSSRKRSRR